MAMDEAVRLRMIVEGEAELDQLKAKLKDVRASIDDMYASMGKGDDFARAAAPHLQDMVGLLGKIGDQEQDLRKLGGGFGNLNDKIFQTGRVLQDFIAGSTYGGLRGGLIAISNNVEQLAATFTKSTLVVQGLAVAMTALPIVLPYLERAFGSLFDLFRDEAPKVFASRLDELRARLKEFEDKKVKVAFDYTEIELTRKRIRELEEAKSALDRTLAAPSRAEIESGRRIAAALTETPGAQDVLAQITARAREAAQRGEGPLGATVADRQRAVDQAVRALEQFEPRAAAIPGGAAIREFMVRQVKEARDRLGLAITEAGAAAEEEIGKVIQQAEKGREAEQRQAQQRLARMFAETGSDAGKGAARAILNADAIKVAQQEEIREAKAETDRLAQDLAKGPLGVEFLRGAEITPDRIRAELEKTLPPETAAKWSDVIARSFTEVMATQVADEAHRTGVVPDEARRQIAARMEAVTPEGRQRAEQARRAIREEEDRQKEAAGRFPDLDLTIRQELLKQRQAGLGPGEAQDLAFRRTEQELARRGLAPGLAETAAARMTIRAGDEVRKLVDSFGSAADALGQARRVLEEEGIAQRARLRSIGPADALSAARAVAAHGLIQAQEEMSRVGNQAIDPLAAAMRQQGQQLQGQAKQVEQFQAGVAENLRRGMSPAEARAAAGAAQARRELRGISGAEPVDEATALARQQAHAAIQLNETYQKFFDATGDKDLAAFLALRELAMTQIKAAANARAMAAGFDSLRDQMRAIQQQVHGVAKSFQMPHGRQ